LLYKRMMRSILAILFVIISLGLTACGAESSNACVFVAAESQVELANGAAFTAACEGDGEFDEERWLRENGSGAKLPSDDEIEQLKNLR